MGLTDEETACSDDDADVVVVDVWAVGADCTSFASAHSSAASKLSNFLKTGWGYLYTCALHSSLA